MRNYQIGKVERLINKIVFKCVVRFFFCTTPVIIIKHFTLFSFFAIQSYLHSVLFIVEGKGLALQSTVIIGLLVGVRFQSFIIFSAKWRGVSG